VNLGHCCYWGTGVEKSLEEAQSWYSKAADAGNVYGMFYAGSSHCETVAMQPRSDLASSWKREQGKQELLMGVSAWVQPTSRVLSEGPEPEVPFLELPEEAAGKVPEEMGIDSIP